MTKILLVEDDKSLREIYGVRLLAEGYDIVSASDGEEALAMAIKERPALMITDIMMPKISGFDVIDILRTTTDTRNIKFIVMTALGSEDQRNRGDQLGADRYLVKSQVGIEDVVRTVHEVLRDNNPQAAAAAQTFPTARPPMPPVDSHVGTPASVYNRPQAPQEPASPAPSETTPIAKTAVPITAPEAAATTIKPESILKNRIIQPLNDPMTSKININDLLDKELAKEAGVDLNNRPTVVTAEREKEIIGNQLQQFSGQNQFQAPPRPAPTVQTAHAPEPTPQFIPTPVISPVATQPAAKQQPDFVSEPGFKFQPAVEPMAEEAEMTEFSVPDLTPTIQIDTQGNVSMPSRLPRPVIQPPAPRPQVAQPAARPLQMQPRMAVNVAPQTTPQFMPTTDNVLRFAPQNSPTQPGQAPTPPPVI